MPYTTAPVSDEELCLLIQAGDREAASVLLVRYRPLVARLVRLARPPARVHFDDLIQAGLLALNRAALKWHPDRNARFKTVAHVYVRNDVRKAVHAEARYFRENLASEGDEYRDRLDVEPDRERPAPDPVDLSALDGTARAVVAFTFGLDGGGPLGSGAVAELLGLTPNQVRAVLDAALVALGRDSDRPFRGPQAGRPWGSVAAA
ncbi:---NA--- : RNA polymerase sigma-H factor OS=Butyrivibrio sp. CAG:318 GN=BN606_00792 PE=4 SV=1: Sigma70_r2 [Gemmataceae bacterium]|nr:---NA--- : RNA polymerase sigma-H factor OS=Butyrivibrio sp. CAG:318 GN=BN606_00792 PE=4 SV=1: Sigma70_r2 [Gemmataceae bacterium]VTT97582.1 ---NA--- : RNA polymerase sigma-H factor OS=Butyrivibrio sp. CAG:318 GN=BN606_00792 PE=4 SV=1: Sigma70_r2 [Gemmataceae bacterium]